MNNKGFSLVELLVAIIVLSIIVIPLLLSFTSATRTNAKARHTMHATTIAETVMEEFEAYTIEEMAATYTSAGMTVEQDADMNGDGVADAGAWKITGTDSTTTSGSYQVEILLNPAAYSAINSTELVDIQNMTGSLNAVYVESEKDAAQAYGVFAGYAGGLTTDQLAGYVTKEINIKVNKDRVTLDLGGGETLETDVYLVMASTFYQCDSSVLDSGAPSKYPQNSSSYVIFSNEDAVKKQAAAIKSKKETGTPLTADDVVVSKLANVVVCLQPRYDGRLDKVVVDNSDNVDANLFLVKQDVSDTEKARLQSIYPGMYDSMTQNYPITFTLKETAPGWMSSAGATVQSHCRLRTNLLKNTNVTYEFYNVSNGSKVSGIAYQDPASEVFQEGPGTIGGCTAVEIMGTDDLTPTQSSNRMYDIRVNVYENGSMGTEGPLLTITGTVTNQ